MKEVKPLAPPDDYAASARDHAKAIECGFAGRLPVQRHCGQFANNRQPRLWVLDRCHRAAVVLPICHIIAFATPGVEQPHSLACCFVE